MRPHSSSRHRRPAKWRRTGRHIKRTPVYHRILYATAAILAWLLYHPASTATGAAIMTALVVLLAGWSGRLARERREMRITNKVKAAVAAVAIIGGAAAGLAANATTLPTLSNTTGLAGYAVQEWNNWHIRDAHATFQITPAMMSLNTTVNPGPTNSTYPGAVGVELCDPNTGNTGQLGLTFLNGAFELLTAYGNLDTMSTGNDPCTQNGVIVTSQRNPAIQLAGANSTFDPTAIFANSTNSTGSQAYVIPGNSGQPTADETPLQVGDTVTLDLYYNPTGSLLFNLHTLTATVNVYRNGNFLVERQYSFTHLWPQNFVEAGIGAQNDTAAQLTAPALNPLVTFSTATFTNYNKSAVNVLNGGWGLTPVNAINGASQVTMQPSTPVGNSFSISEGSASA